MLNYQNVTIEQVRPIRPGFAAQALPAKRPDKVLTAENYEFLQTIGYPIHAWDGQMLYHEGDAQTALFILLAGKVKVGNRSHKPVWIDMGTYGLIDMAEDEGRWEWARTYSQVVCLGELDYTPNGFHSQTAMAVGECNLLVVNIKALKKALKMFPGQGEDLLENLHQLMI